MLERALWHSFMLENDAARDGAEMPCRAKIPCMQESYAAQQEPRQG